MPRRYFNWKLAIVLIISICVLGVTAFGLRQWQRTNRADQGLILGNKAYDEQRWEEAAENFGRYLAIEQIDVPILHKYAEAQLKIRPSKRSNIAQAENAYRIILRVDKDNFKAAMQLTELYLSRYMYRPGEAELIASKYLDNNDDSDPKLREMLALAMARQRKFTEAAAELRAIVQEHPGQILAYEMLGLLTEQRPDDFPDPVQWLDEAVKNNPSSALAYIVRAGFYQSKDSAKALTDLEQAEKLDLSDPNVELRLAGEFIITNDLDKAEKHLISVQASIPTDTRVWARWAELAMKSNSKEKMQKIAEAGLKELSSQPWDFMPTATELFIRSGQLDRAAEYISEMNQKDIAPIEVTFLEGRLAAERGHLFKAINYWQESMGLGNTFPQVRLALSSVLSRVGNTQSALRQLRALVSENPDFITGHLALAKLLAQGRNWAESARYAAIAKQLSPENSEAILLDLQAKIQLQALSSAGKNVQMFQDIEKELTELEKAVNNLLEIKLLKFQLALLQNNFTDAQALVTQLKNDYPSQIMTTMAEVGLLVAQDKKDEAMLILLKALDEFPQAIEPVIYLTDLLDRQGDKEKCEEIIKEALERIDQPVAKRTLGLLLRDLYIKWNQNDNVYSLLNTLVQELPEDILLKRRLLFCEQVIGDPERAQKLVEDIKSLEGEEGWQWRYEQAKIWLLSEDFEAHYAQIVSLLQKNLQVNPNDQGSRMLLAVAYDISGVLQLAISTYREALSRSPDHPQIVAALVAALYKAKEDEEAQRLLERASQQTPDNPQLQLLSYQSYLRRDELGSASDVLEDFLSNDPNNQAARLAFAKLKTQQGHFDEAEELLTKLKIQDPNSLPVAVAQIQLNIRQNKPAETLKLCDEIISNLDNADAYMIRAGTYSSFGQNDKAIEDFEHAAAIEPNNVEVWMAKSEFYRFIGRPVEAIADIKYALSLASSDIRIQKQAIRLFLESGDADKVLQGKTILTEALNSNPDDNDLLLFEVGVLISERTAPSFNKAEQHLRKITEGQPEISRAWELLGEIFLIQGQAEKAMETVFRGLSYTPNDKELLLLKAHLEKKRSPVLAIPTLKALLEVDPNNTNATLSLAGIYIKVSEPEKAVNLLEAQLASRIGTPEERIIKIALAVALHKNGDKADAQKHFDSLLKSEPDDPAPLVNQVGLLRDEQLWTQLNQKVAEWYHKHPEDSRTLINIARDLMAFNDIQSKTAAEDVLRMVLKNESDSIDAMTTIATLLYSGGRSDESVPLYQKVIQLQSNNQVAINNLAWILCEDNGKPQEALELAQKGLKIYPDYIDLIDTRGFIYYQMGEYDKAVEDFTTCTEMYLKGMPAAVASHFRLAKTFVKLGQNVKAINHLNQALNLESQIGGLSNLEIDEAQRLLKQLQEGN
ncbi:MAG: tetratricopeptide repeat protein [Planctomycetes bacterium]|nr:tetratricopeptide repeat protein [Planctomycetota bacterium]MBL7143379.1 tetratricopeptide repeat protein [Phycisphaerae bacterium]